MIFNLHNSHTDVLSLPLLLEIEMAVLRYYLFFLFLLKLVIFTISVTYRSHALTCVINIS